MYYLYYGIWFGIKPRVPQKYLTAIYLSILGLVVLIGVSMMITALSMLGVF